MRSHNQVYDEFLNASVPRHAHTENETIIFYTRKRLRCLYGKLNDKVTIVFEVDILYYFHSFVAKLNLG